MRPAGGHQPPRAGRGMGRDLGMRYMAPGAFTVLPPDGAPPPDPPSAPQPYRLTPNTKRHKHQSFAIIGEPSTNPNSRSDSPSGRVSPFKGRGFNPAGSRHASPAPSPTPPPNQHRHESHRNESPKHSSKIPQYSRRGSASAFGEKVTHYDPSIGSSENRRLSQSQPNLQGKKSKKPPISPRKKGAPAFQQLSPIVGSSPEPAHSMSSPSRIPKSRSTPPSRFVSPDRQGQHDGKPPLSRAPSRSVSRLANSRDNSRDGSPSQMPSTPIKVPARYRNVQAKVNSFNKPKPKVPPKPELSTVLSETDSSDVPNPSAKRPALARKDSVNKTSKPSALPKPTNNANSDSSTSTDNFNKNKATPRMSRRDSMKLINSNKVPDSNESKTKPSTSKPNSKPSSVEPKRKNEKHHGMSEESGVSNSNMSTPHHTVVASTTKTVTKPLKIDTKLDNAHYDKHQKVTPMVDGRVLSATSVSNALNKMSDSVLNSNTVIKDHGQSKLSPAANAIIAVGNEKKERDNFPETYKENNSNKMGSNSKLSGSDKNIASSKNEQRNDTHNTHNMGDSNKSSSHQTPSKNNSLSGSQKNLNQMNIGQKSMSQTPTSHITTTGTTGHHTNTHPMTSVAMTTGHTTTTTSHTTTMTTTNQKTTDHTHTGHIPSNEMTTGQKPTSQTPIGQATTNQTNTAGQKVFGQTPTHHSSTRPKLNDTRMDSKDSNNIHDQRMSDSNGKINNHTNHVGHTLTGHSRALETEVQKNLDKFITPGIAAANSVQKSVNDRIREARTMIASDVKPINIMVREKPSEVAVQSGNIRFQGMANGLDDRPSLPPSHEAHPPNDPPKEEPPPNACSRFLASCKNKLSCECCKKLETPNQENETEEKQTTGCFSCCKSKKKEQEVRINVEGEEPKPTFCERLNCCKNSRKVKDSSSCFPLGKRKDSWATRRDSIFGGRQQDPPKKKCTCSKDCCKNFLKALFCINLCVWCASCCKKKPVETVSRKPSIISGKKKSLTPVTLPPPEDTKPKIDISLVEHSSHMKGAIPVLPVPLAWFCLVMNCILPGTGTIFSGMFCLCLGIPRFSQKDGAKQRIGAFLIDLIIGFSQAFTILFCLVGWGWAIWWGVIMVKVAKKHRKFKQQEAEEEANEAAAAAAVPVNNQNNRRDVERGHRRT